MLRKERVGMRLNELNRQVAKNQEILDDLKEQIAEYERLEDEYADPAHPDRGLAGFPVIGMVLKYQKKVRGLQKKVDERERMIEEKTKRRDVWLAGKAMVARDRVDKIKSRLGILSSQERLDIGLGESGIMSYGSTSEEQLDALGMLIEGLESKLQALLAMKELMVMVDSVYGGMDEIKEADEELLEAILGVFLET